MFNTAFIQQWKHEITAHGSPYGPPKSRPNPLQDQQWAAVTRFFDHTLNTDQPVADKTLFYYTPGAETWRATATFPLPNTELQTWYFQTGNGLAPTPPIDAEPDTYRVDFAATTGKTNRWHTQMARPLIYPDRAQADRRLLTYTSPARTGTRFCGFPPTARRSGRFRGARCWPRISACRLSAERWAWRRLRPFKRLMYRKPSGRGCCQSAYRPLHMMLHPVQPFRVYAALAA